MWNVSPEFLCSKHLLGEHFEMHKFLGALRNGKSIQGYIDHGLVEVHNIIKRHDELAEEVEKRGMNHRSPVGLEDAGVLYHAGEVGMFKNIGDLCVRCPECRKNLLEGKL